jgi:hypothetical protein
VEYKLSKLKLLVVSFVCWIFFVIAYESLDILASERKILLTPILTSVIALSALASFPSCYIIRKIYVLKFETDYIAWKDVLGRKLNIHFSEDIRFEFRSLISFRYLAVQTKQFKTIIPLFFESNDALLKEIQTKVKL